jgi:hypothetical protein
MIGIGGGIPDNVSQLGLFTTRAEGAEKAFWEFHNKYPQVADQLFKLAFEAKLTGHRKLGVKMLYEVLRWNVLMGHVKDVAGIKLNNNYASRYARLIMATHMCRPDCAGCYDATCMVGFFDTRELHHPSALEPQE